MQEQAFYSAQGAASLLDVSGETIRRWIKAGKIRGAERSDRAWRIPRAEVDRLQAEKREGVERQAPDAETVDRSEEDRAVRAEVAVPDAGEPDEGGVERPGMAVIKSHAEKVIEDAWKPIERRLHDIESGLRTLIWVLLGVLVLVALIIGLRKR